MAKLRGRRDLVTLHPPCWLVCTSLFVTQLETYSITAVDATVWQSSLEVEELCWRASEDDWRLTRL